MSAPDPTRPSYSSADPALRDALMQLVGFGVRIARVAAEMAEAEARIVASATTDLPMTADTLGAAQQAGAAIDAGDLALAQASPRVAAASLSFDRVARAVRRTAALVQRLDRGWAGRIVADDRRAMARRHIARSVAERIAEHTDAEIAERFHEDLMDRLDTLDDDDLYRPAERVIAAICQELGLDPAPRPMPPPADPATPRWEARRPAPPHPPGPS